MSGLCWFGQSEREGLSELRWLRQNADGQMTWFGILLVILVILGIVYFIRHL